MVQTINDRQDDGKLFLAHMLDSVVDFLDEHGMGDDFLFIEEISGGDPKVFSNIKEFRQGRERVASCNVTNVVFPMPQFVTELIFRDPALEP